MTTEQRIKEILETARSSGGVTVSTAPTYPYKTVFLSGHITSTSKAMVDLLNVTDDEGYYILDNLQTYVVNQDVTKLTVLLHRR